MRNSIIYTVLVFGLLIVSCGKITPKGDLESKDIPLENFKELNLKGKFRVFYINHNKNFINVETYGNISDNLKIDVFDDILSIKEKSETENVDFYNITIYSKSNPTKIKMTDEAELNVSGEINTPAFNLILDKNAKFIGSIKTEQTNIEMKNLSRANFSGESKKVSIKIMDTASIIAPYWNIKNLNLDSKNGSYTEVNVKDTLKGKVKNSAKLLYYNNPIIKFSSDKSVRIENKKL